jgi:hypothetical protein
MYIVPHLYTSGFSVLLTIMSSEATAGSPCYMDHVHCVGLKFYLVWTSYTNSLHYSVNTCFHQTVLIYLHNSDWNLFVS